MSDLFQSKKCKCKSLKPKSQFPEFKNWRVFMDNKLKKIIKENKDANEEI